MIKEKIAKLKSGRFEDQLFIQFLIWVTLPMIVMGFVSYYIYVNGESEKNQLILESYGKHMSVDYDNIFIAVREYYLDLTRGESYKWLVQQDEVPYSNYMDVNKAQAALRGSYFISSYIKMYNFINVKEGWVLNNYGMFDYEDTKNLKQVERFLTEQQGINNTLYWINRSHVQSPYEDNVIGSKYIDVSGELLILKNTNAAGEIINILTIQLNLAALNSIGQSYHQMGYEVTILDGEILFMQTEEEMTQTFLAADEDTSGIYRSSRGNKYNISVNKAKANGLTYVVGYNTKMDKQNAIVFLYAAVAIILGFGVIFFVLRGVARNASRPFLTLEKFAEDQNLHIKELLVSNLIKGELNDQRIQAYFEKYNWVPWKYYRMVGVICKNVDESQSSGTAKLESRLLAELPEEILQKVFIAPVLYENVVFFIVGHDDEVEVDNKTALVYKWVKDFAAEQYQCQIASGISRTFKELTQTSRAYNECMEALHSRIRERSTSDSTLALYDDYDIIGSHGSVYDIIMENELAGAIESCNLEESKRLLEFVVRRTELKGFFGIERTFYITKLAMDILSIPVKLSLPLSVRFKDEQYDILNRAGQIYEEEELIRYLERELLEPVIRILQDNQKSTILDVIHKVVKMIQESKGNVTLNECAETLNYHPNYISKVLKQEKGMTFTELTNVEKLRMAKYMLLTTEHSVAEISQSLQYNNVQNFIRFFKNQEGTTPSKYRKEHRS